MAIVVLPVAVSVAAAVGCKQNKDDDNDPDDPGPSFWLVGDQGTMLQFDGLGEPQTYPLEHDGDLLAIACHGANTAWTVGAGGTVLKTRDVGRTWQTVDVSTAADLRAVAIAEHTPEGIETVWIVGDDGVVLHSDDGGSSFTTHEAPGDSLTAVTTDADGEVAFATADDGTIWRLTTAAAEVVHDGGGRLWGVSMATHPDDHDAIVAVGDDGAAWRSEDGLSWSALELGTTRDLYAVRVSAGGELTLAVGEAGVVVQAEAAGVLVDERLDAGVALRALHVGADGRGQAVGDAGVVLLTGDAGMTWTHVDGMTDATLRGVDDFHRGGHL